MNMFLTQFWTVKLLIHKPQPRLKLMILTYSFTKKCTISGGQGQVWGKWMLVHIIKISTWHKIQRKTFKAGYVITKTSFHSSI